MINEQPFTAGKVALNVAETGDGPPLVLLHGVTRGWRDFACLIPSLTTRWRVVAPDLRGHGRSARVAGAYAVADYVDDVVALVEQLDSPAVVLGHSLGAMLALAVAARAYDRVRAVILEDPPFHTMGERIAEAGLLDYFEDLRQIARLRTPVVEVARALGDILVRSPSSGEMVRMDDVRDGASLRFHAACLVAVDPEILDSIVAGRWLVGYDYQRMFERVRCPALVLQADPAFGGMLTDSDVDIARERMPDCVSVRVPNVGHHIHAQATESMLRLVHAFLESL